MSFSVFHCALENPWPCTELLLDRSRSDWAGQCIYAPPLTKGCMRCEVTEEVSVSERSVYLTERSVYLTERAVYLTDRSVTEKVSFDACKTAYQNDCRLIIYWHIWEEGKLSKIFCISVKRGPQHHAYLGDITIIILPPWRVHVRWL